MKTTDNERIVNDFLPYEALSDRSKQPLTFDQVCLLSGVLTREELETIMKLQGADWVGSFRQELRQRMVKAGWCEEMEEPEVMN